MRCNVCKKPKTLKQMSKDSNDRRGYRGSCKLCMAKKSAKYRVANPEKYKAILRLCARKRLYGLDGIKHFEKQRKLQKVKCAICRRPMTKVCSDHDHETGKWRGVLCDNCNRGIGLLGDSIKTLQAAITYLQKWKRK